MNDTIGRAYIVVSGKVQGVSFRYHTQERARALGLSGWVRNVPHGEVEVLAEGPEAALAALIAWCGEGPPAALVTAVAVDRAPPTGEFSGFAIRR